MIRVFAAALLAVCVGCDSSSTESGASTSGGTTSAVQSAATGSASTSGPSVTTVTSGGAVGSSSTTASTGTTSGGVGEAALQIQPNPIVFTGVPMGMQASQTITIQNIGSAPANISCITLASIAGGCNAGSATLGFSGLPPSGTELLASSATLTFTLTYTASGGSDVDALSVVFTSQGSAGTQMASAQIIGNQPDLTPCTLTITPAAVSFGAVTVGTTLTRSVTLTNSGEVDCAVSNVQVDPASDPSFTLDGSRASSFTVLAGGAATIEVDFSLNSSSTPSIRTGAVDFTTNDPTQATASIPLIAYVEPPNDLASGWPKWHADSNNSGVSAADTSANTGSLVWKYAGLTSAQTLNNQGVSASCGGETYLSSPVIQSDSSSAGYTIYQLSLDGNLYALNQSGNLLWKSMTTVPTVDPHPSTPLVDQGGTVWVVSGATDGGSPNDSDDLFFIGPNGTPLGELSYGKAGFAACPTLSADGVFFEADAYGATGVTTDPYTALAFTEGAQDAVTVAAGLALPLSEHSQRFGIAVGPDDTTYWANNGQFFALSPPASDFAVNANWPSGGVTTTSNVTDTHAVGPVFSDLAFDAYNTGFVFAYSAWEDGLSINGGYYANGTTTGPYSVQGQLVALSAATGAIQWSLSLPETALPTGWSRLCSDYGNAAPAVNVDGTVYVGNGDGLRAVDGATGSVKWLFASANVSSAPAIGGDGTVFFGCQDGSFYAVNSDGSQRYHLQAGAPVSSSPAIADDGTVFFVSDDGTLWAVR